VRPPEHHDGRAGRHPVPPLFEDGPVAERRWLAFDDPVLARLVGREVADNLAIRRTVSRVREARAVARGGAA
jgi:outer membrane protein TolC